MPANKSVTTTEQAKYILILVNMLFLKMALIMDIISNIKCEF